VAAAADRLRRYGFVRTQELDPSSGRALEDPAPGSADIVILTLHASDADIAQRLAAARDLLRPHGLLLAIDARTASSPAIRFLLGLLDGAEPGTFETTRRPDWSGRLRVAGFGDVAESEAGLLSVLAARAPEQGLAPVEAASLAGERWIVIGSGELARSIAHEVDARGGSAHARAWEDERTDLPTLPAERIVALLPDTADPATAAEGLLRIVQALAGSDRQISVLSRGCQAFCGERGSRNLSHAAAWGIARVMANEHPELGLRLIDLEADAAPGEAAEIVNEIRRHAAGEPAEHFELALRGSLRFAPRLLRYSRQERADGPTPALDDATRWVVALERPGDLASLCLRSAARRAPARDEIEIAVEAQAVNFRDSLIALGMLDRAKASPPGTDSVGTIVRIGEGVEGFEVGQRVVGIAPGWFSSFVTVPAALFVPLPSKLSAFEAVTLPLVGATVEVALCDEARLRPGDTVLVHSGAGGLGLAAIRLAQHIGARVFATAGTAQKRAWLLALGVDRVFDSRTIDFHREILEATQGRGVDVVLNSLSGDALDKGVDLMAAGGRFIELGKRDAYSDRPVGLGNLIRNASVHLVDLDELCARDPERVGRTIGRVFARCEALGWRGLPYVRMPASRFDDALRSMASGLLTGKLVVDIAGSSVTTVPDATSAPFPRPDGLYLITGGLSGFGLETARWLVARGARHLALVGRSAPREEALQAIALIRASGAEVTTLAADVSQASEVERMLAELRAQQPPLRGIFHAAAVYDDATVTNVSAESFERVFAPKALGAWNLHRATRGDALDLFVLFSSIGRPYGATGQASYVAANEYLSALAAVRRAAGLPALCIDWGAIADVGYLARNLQVRARLSDIGAAALQGWEALDMLAEVLSTGQSTLAIARVDWNRLGESLPALPMGTKLRALKQASASDVAAVDADACSFQTVLAESDTAQREALALAFVRNRAARVLRAPATSLDGDIPLVELGFDSLMEVELRAVLQRDAGAAAAARRVLRGSSLRSIGRSLLEHAGAGLADAAPGVPKQFVAWLDERERVLNDFRSRLDAQELTQALVATIDALSGHVDHLSEAEHAVHRAAFRRRLSPFFLLSPLLQRALEKPLGYAGDFEIMNHIYSDSPRGSGLERAVDALALSRPAAVANRNRVPYLTKRISDLVETRGRLRVASVGCGPAREIRALATHHPALLQKLDILLLDQDERALQDCKRALDDARVPGLSVEFVLASVEELTQPGSRADVLLGRRDLVYSAGLFDYFNDQNFARYLQAMYAHLEPGGQLWVGNISSESPDRWLLEYVTDWFLYHRSRTDLEKYRALLQPTPCAYAIDCEETGVNLFLVARRPA
jgi:NADPH:quinone reductase-like Zn-dependent oxidoreductase/SAM-dependent methyltransferase